MKDGIKFRGVATRKRNLTVDIWQSYKLRTPARQVERLGS
jgi:hypothetical protein